MRLQVGVRTSTTVRITDEHIELFARLTGDRNPIHLRVTREDGTRAVEGEAAVLIGLCYRPTSEG